jgi:hypothetical protein
VEAVITIYLSGRNPYDVLIEALRAIHIDGESVRIVAESGSAAHTLASAPEFPRPAQPLLRRAAAVACASAADRLEAKQLRRSERPRWRQ